MVGPVVGPTTGPTTADPPVGNGALGASPSPRAEDSGCSPAV